MKKRLVNRFCVLMLAVLMIFGCVAPVSAAPVLSAEAMLPAAEVYSANGGFWEHAIVSGSQIIDIIPGWETGTYYVFLNSYSGTSRTFYLYTTAMETATNGGMLSITLQHANGTQVDDGNWYVGTDDDFARVVVGPEAGTYILKITSLTDVPVHVTAAWGL